MPLIQRHTYIGKQPGPHLLLTAGVHGDEYEGIAALSLFRWALEDGDFRGTVTVAPTVNEPAWEAGARCGEDGLDLARACPGDPNGAPTQQIAAELTELIQSADYYVDLHTGGTALEVYPLAGYMLVPDEDIRNTQRHMAVAFGLPLVWGTSAALEGRSLSAARDAGVPAIYCEYLGGGRYSHAGTDAYFRGCLRVMAALGMTDEVPPARTPPLKIEDSRPGSGHLQVCHPSPAAGIFIPEADLGGLVKEGQRLGEILSREGVTVPITANQTGRLIVRRTFPKVEPGDSLGVILETTDPFPPYDR